MPLKFEEVKKDYLAIIKEHGRPYDMTGGFVDAEKMEVVILNPTKINAAKYMRDVIYYGFQFKQKHWRNEYGDYISIEKSDIVKRVYKKYIE